MHQQAVVRGAVAQRGEGGRGLLDAPVPPEHVGGIERPGPDHLADPEELALVEAKDIDRVQLGRDREGGRSRCPPPGGVQLGHDEPVVGQHGDDVPVAVPLLARAAA